MYVYAEESGRTRSEKKVGLRHRDIVHVIGSEREHEIIVQPSFKPVIFLMINSSPSALAKCEKESVKRTLR